MGIAGDCPEEEWELLPVAEGHRRRKVADLRNPEQPSKVGYLKEYVIW